MVKEELPCAAGENKKKKTCLWEVDFHQNQNVLNLILYQGT